MLVKILSSGIMADASAIFSHVQCRQVVTCCIAASWLVGHRQTSLVPWWSCGLPALPLCCAAGCGAARAAASSASLSSRI